MLRKVYRLLSMILCTAVLFAGCVSEPNKEERADAALLLPEMSGEITDVRITAVPQENPVKDSAVENASAIQIYYGYQSDGVWYDYPSENYELRGILHNWAKMGYETAGTSHIVQIGPYLLICIDDANISRDENAVISDTLGTEVITPLKEYWKSEYVYLKEDREAILAGDETAFRVSSPFSLYYFLIVEMEDLTEDYELWISYQNGAEQVEQGITMEDIDFLLRYDEYDRDTARVIEESRYYKITEQNGLYYVLYYNTGGDEVKLNGALLRMPDVTVTDDGLIRCSIETEADSGSYVTDYYDPNLDEFSGLYWNVFEQKDGKVLYRKQNTVVVRDIFREENGYWEFAEFSESLADVELPIVDAKFSDDGSSVTVNYLAGAEARQIQETFDLNAG